jgi:sugar phosphate isomerase/epimerase
MAQLSINEMTTYRWSFEEDVQHFRAAGIGAIGVWRQKLADFGENRGIDLLADSGLKVSNLLWAGGFTGSDGHSFRESVSDAMDAIRLAAALSAGCLVVYTGGRNGHTQNHARRLFTSALAELLPLTTELDVTLAIEPMHSTCAEECTFLTSLEEAVTLIETLGNDRLKIVFDTYHFGSEPHILDRIPQLIPLIAIVHLGDSKGPPDGEQNRSPLGEGVLPLREIIATLRQCGYDGYFDVELMGEEIESSRYDVLLDSTKTAFANLVAPKASYAVPPRR